jgi:hypothetical protein
MAASEKDLIDRGTGDPCDKPRRAVRDSTAAGMKIERGLLDGLVWFQHIAHRVSLRRRQFIEAGKFLHAMAIVDLDPPDARSAISFAALDSIRCPIQSVTQCETVVDTRETRILAVLEFLDVLQRWTEGNPGQRGYLEAYIHGW